MPTIRLAAAKGAELTPTEADADMKRTAVAQTSDYALDATHNREFHQLGGSVATVTLPTVSASFTETDDWFVDFRNNLTTSITFGRNSQNIDGAAADFILPAGGSVRIRMDAATAAFYTNWGQSVHGVSAYRTANQDHDSGSSGTWDAIVYNVTTNGYNHGTALNTTTGLITPPAWATYFNVNATTGFSAHATGDYRGIALATSTASNGATIFEYGDRKVPSGTIADFLRVSTGWIPTSYVSSFYVLSYQSSLTSLAQAATYMRLYVEFK